LRVAQERMPKVEPVATDLTSVVNQGENPFGGASTTESLNSSCRVRRETGVSGEYHGLE